MVFSAEEYIDKQFLSFQGFIAKLSSSMPVLNLASIKDEKQLIRALVSQNKAYAKKILDLFEELSNEAQTNGNKGQIEALNTSKSIEIQSATSKINPRDSAHFDEDKNTRDASDLSILERKIDYLNSLYMQTKKQSEEKDTTLKAFTQQIEELNVEKERLENDLQELMEEFAQVKDKYEDQAKDLQDMEKYIADLKKKGVTRETPLKTPVEHEHIPELNEELEELKERLEQKEKTVSELKERLENKEKAVNELRAQVAAVNTKRVQNDDAPQLQAYIEQVEDLTASKERLETDLQELMEEFTLMKDKYEKQAREIQNMEKYIAESKKREPTRETSLKATIEHEQIEDLKKRLEQKERTISELKAQNATLNSKKSKSDDLPQLQDKVLDLGLRLRELRALLLSLCAKAELSREERGVSSPTKLRKDKLGAEDISDILDQEHVAIVDSLRRMAVDLLNQPAKQIVIQRSESPRKASLEANKQLREELELINEEIKQKSRITLDTLARETREQLVQQLESEIEENRILREKVEKLSFTLESVLLAVQDDLDRLSLIHEYARKSTTAEEFRLQIQACKTKVGELLTPELREEMTLSEEYENQKRLWQEKNEQQAKLFREDLTRLREELENQKQMTLDQEKELNDQINAITREFEENRIQHAEEVEQYEEKVGYLEREQENLNNYLEDLRRSKAEVENILSEREETIINYSKTISEWQVKCGYLEADIRKALNEKTKMQDLVFEKDQEIENVKIDRSDLQSNVRTLNATIESLERRQRGSDQDIIQKTKRIDELQVTIKEEQQRWSELNDQIKTEYRDYVEETERTTEELKENYERLIGEYNIQLEDLRRYTEQLRKAQESQNESHAEEIRRLTEINEEVSERARAQAEALRNREDRINKVEDELRKAEFKNRTMEDALSEMNLVKDKNKKYFEMLSTSNVELNTLKIESQGLLGERNDALEKAAKIEKAYIDLREELRKAVEQNTRLKEAIHEGQAEIRALKEEVDKSHRKLVEKERELKNTNEDYLNQSRTTIGYKDETINRLKIDLKQVTNDYESLRREYQDIIERNEDALFENEKLKQIVLDKELSFNEIEKLNNMNDDLLIQNEHLKNEKRRIEEESEREKRSLVLEINNLKNRTIDLQSSLQKRSK